MFNKLSLLAFAAPLVSALTLQVPENPTSAGQITIKWTSAPNDPETFSFELINTAFNNAFAIANNVNPTAGQLTLTLPPVPVGDGYTLEAVNIGNINDVFASSPSFSIGAATTTSSSGSSTSASSTASGSRSVSGTASASVTGTSSIRPTSTSNSLVSPSPSSTQPSTSASSSSSSGAAPTSFNNSGAFSSRIGATGIAALLVSVAAGAAAIAL
ncbi:hypothetical protein D9613_004392 [Agrocybe pediades]|uniref:Yeast cell wall synthesis Kre9/Knh1-like N-terminal domain-containing protein n=1 Tax=Agrocybe pediades TaxID=84607 RepID=A0A8H4VJ06_9AGAR|nr:hypothetical protein D9613_004392 [Agrocybe pediades]